MYQSYNNPFNQEILLTILHKEQVQETEDPITKPYIPFQKVRDSLSDIQKNRLKQILDETMNYIKINNGEKQLLVYKVVLNVDPPKGEGESEGEAESKDESEGEGDDESEGEGEGDDESEKKQPEMSVILIFRDKIIKDGKTECQIFLFSENTNISFEEAAFGVFNLDDDIIKSEDDMHDKVFYHPKVLALGRKDIHDDNFMYTDDDYDYHYDYDRYGTHVLLYESPVMWTLKEPDHSYYMDKFMKDVYSLHETLKAIVESTSMNSVQPKPQPSSECFQPIPQQSSNIYILFVEGLGCKYDKKDQDEFKTILTDIINPLVNKDTKRTITIDISCYENTLKQFRSVLSHLFKPGNTFPKIDIQYVNTLYGKASGYLEQGHEVIVMGFSYGGSVVSRIAELFSRDPRFYKTNEMIPHLYMATFGSVYVPKTIQTNRVNITHYLFDKDIALTFNHINRKKVLSFFRTPKKTQVTDIRYSIHQEYKNVRFCVPPPSNNPGTNNAISTLLSGLWYSMIYEGKQIPNTAQNYMSRFEVHRQYFYGMIKYFISKVAVRIQQQQDKLGTISGGAKKNKGTIPKKRKHNAPRIKRGKDIYNKY